MSRGILLSLSIFSLAFILFTTGCKTAEITYLGLIKTRYPNKQSPEKNSATGKSSGDSAYARVVVEHLGQKLAATNNPSATITIQGQIFKVDSNTPSKHNFMILNTNPQKRSTYTDTAGFFKFINIPASDLSLRVFNEFSWSFFEIPLEVKDLSSLNQINIILVPGKIAKP